ncbi:hypothetical protein [Ralstonia nicotianae]|uniref:Uncharacterized protein n=1 Tax=Ralstonia nicotianae TaxID=3037696 RepID=A0ABX7ZSL2_9RALS|nr:hypothetical protein [Ralstonia nicotianae]QUP58425.1 hypothetical protein GO999_07525 [Ralstonia nicotianae]
MPSEEYVRNLQTSAMKMGIVSMCLQDLVSQIIWHVLNGGVLDDSAFATIKAKCIHNLKGVEGRGMPIEQEADSLDGALQIFEEMVSVAIANGKNLKY